MEKLNLRLMASNYTGKSVDYFSNTHIMEEKIVLSKKSYPQLWFPQ